MRELMGWYAYYQVEPWGERHAWERAAMIASTIYNMMRGKGSRARGLREFLPQWFKPTKGGGRQSSSEQLEIMKSIFSNKPHKEHDPRKAKR